MNPIEFFQKNLNQNINYVGLDQSGIIDYHINSEGFRSSVNYDFSPACAFFGCSSVFGIGVSESEILSSYFTSSQNYGLATTYTNENIYQTIIDFMSTKNYIDTNMVVVWCDKKDVNMIPDFINELPKTIMHFKIGFEPVANTLTLPAQIDLDISGTHPGPKTHKLWAYAIKKFYKN